MRQATSQIWDTWQSGTFVGDAATHGRVTVEPGWFLNVSSGPVGTFQKLPIRWFQKCDDSQTEIEVPNVKSISWDKNVDVDAATCNISLYNQWMDPNDSWRQGTVVQELGNPGSLTWNHGASADARSRWGHQANVWANVLVPNALLRTYQGYGGRDKTVAQARADGNLVRTGVWLIDEVRVGTNGMIELKCRDMMKLLIEQILYPPLVPHDSYPLHYQRWKWVDGIVQSLVAAEGEKRRLFSLSGNQAWFNNGTVIPVGGTGNGVTHGHSPEEAYDGNPETYWISTGNGDPHYKWAWEYVQADCGDYVDTVYIHPVGHYQVFISVMENGVWQGTDTIPYNPGCTPNGCVGRYHDNQFEARIPFVMQAGVPNDTPVEIKLPRSYKADRIRCTFTELIHYAGSYRAVIREIRHFLRSPVTDSQIKPVRVDGNYKDIADIIKELLLWSGWWCQEDTPANEYPHVFGNIEQTGFPGDKYENNDYEITTEPFDKQPVINAITRLKELVAYVFYVDDDGGIRFEPPNWWKPGNNFLEDGSPTDFVPEVDERLVLTDYTVQYGDSAVRSEVIITTYDPEDESYQDLSDNGDGTTTATTRFIPDKLDPIVFRGMIRPWTIAMPEGIKISKEDQQFYAELINLQLWFSQRQGQVTCVGNPAININDQVRIYERLTGESYIHYVRGISMTHDLDTGNMTMTLTTNWLGDNSDWVFDMTGSEEVGAPPAERVWDANRWSSVQRPNPNHPGPGYWQDFADIYGVPDRVSELIAFNAQRGPEGIGNIDGSLPFGMVVAVPNSWPPDPHTIPTALVGGLGGND